MLKSTLVIATLCAFSAVATTGGRADGDALSGTAAAAQSPPERGGARANDDIATRTGPSGLAMAAAALLVLTGLSRRRGL